MDVGDHTTTRDGRLDEGVKLLVTTNGELKVAGCDTLDLSERGMEGGGAIIRHVGTLLLEHSDPLTRA